MPLQVFTLLQAYRKILTLQKRRSSFQLPFLRKRAGKPSKWVHTGFGLPCHSKAFQKPGLRQRRVPSVSLTGFSFLINFSAAIFASVSTVFSSSAYAHCILGEIYVPFVGWKCADINNHPHFEGSRTSIQFEIESDYPQIIHMNFYNGDRSSIWPSGNRVYVIDDYELHEYDLSCVAGQKICYAAWAKNDPTIYWGLGKGGHESCIDCCYVCGNTTTAGPINLTD